MHWCLITNLHWGNIESNRKEEMKLIECNTHSIYPSAVKPPISEQKWHWPNIVKSNQGILFGPSFWWSTIVNRTIVLLNSGSGSKAFIILLLLRPSVPSTLNRPPKGKDQRVCSNRQFASNYICSLNTSILIRQYSFETINEKDIARARSGKIVYQLKVPSGDIQKMALQIRSCWLLGHNQ